MCCEKAGNTQNMVGGLCFRIIFKKSVALLFFFFFFSQISVSGDLYPLRTDLFF